MTGDRVNEPPHPSRPAPLRVGAWLVYPALNRIARGTETIQLGPRIMHLLLALAERPGEVVTRTELMDKVWQDVVVSEETLTMAVSDLRRALGDDPRSPRMIETIRKSGYRLIATVTRGGPPSPRAKAFQSAGIGLPRWALVPLCAILLAALASLVLRLRQPVPAQFPAHLLRSTPLTSYPSSEITPALSCSGTRVAFAWGGEGEGDLDIYVKQLHSEPPLRLTSDSGAELYPAWSPDDATIAFGRWGPEAGVFTVPSIGGPARRMATAPSGVIGLDWSPDGRYLVYAAQDPATRRYEVFRLTVDSLTVRVLSPASDEYPAHLYPALSPDGGMLAWVRSDRAGLHDIWLTPTAGGAPRRLTHAQRVIFGLDWSADGRGVVFAAAPTGDLELWFVSLADGALTWLPTTGDMVQYPSVSARDRLLAYEEVAYDYDIWSLELTDDRPLQLPSTPLISSTREDSNGRFSCDGNQIAFISTRSGKHELWTCNRDGSHLRQLTHLTDVYPESPHWSPQGDQIAFLGYVGGCAALHVVDVASGLVARLHQGGGHELLADWSRDGQWLYYSVLRPDGAQIWRTRPDGTDAEALIADGRQLLHEISDGRLLYYFRADASGLWQRSLDGGVAERIVDAAVMLHWTEIEAVDEGLYYTQPQGMAVLLGYYDIASGKSDTLATIPRFGGAHLAVSPQGDRLLYDRSERLDCDLMLIEGFQ